ncbi:MAG: stage III sporulation protein AB [Dethiobacter sp.]|jgi:stage III sporulation protein AB|nr:stage III sporulation protein AB [Dethiobacter sp.]
MLVKWFGALLILGAAYSFGNSQAQRLRRRVAELEEFRLALRLLMAEIGYTATPLPKAMDILSARLRRVEVGAFFRAVKKNLAAGGQGSDASMAWMEGAVSVKKELALTEEDMAVLVRAGAGLGGLGREEQVRQLELVDAQLAQLAAEAAHGCRDREKMWRYLGVLGGVAVVILLL